MSKYQVVACGRHDYAASDIKRAALRHIAGVVGHLGMVVGVSTDHSTSLSAGSVIISALRLVLGSKFGLDAVGRSLAPYRPLLSRLPEFTFNVLESCEPLENVF